MTEIYIFAALIWCIGALYTFGLKWMVSKYEQWPAIDDIEKIFQSALIILVGWPFLLGMLHAPAFIDLSHAIENKAEQSRR